MNQRHTNLFYDMMDVALRLDRLEQMYQIDSDKRPVIEFYFEEISDLAKMEVRILSSMEKVIMGGVGYERVGGHSEFSDCREYNLGPVTFRLRCGKVLDTKGGKRLGVRDILFTHRTH